MFELSPTESNRPGLKFRNPETGAEFIVAVEDKFPQMGDVHIEGRRTVELSVEMFMALMEGQGYLVVDPKTDDVVTKEETE